MTALRLTCARITKLPGSPCHRSDRSYILQAVWSDSFYQISNSILITIQAKIFSQNVGKELHSEDKCAMSGTSLFLKFFLLDKMFSLQGILSKIPKSNVFIATSLQKNLIGRLAERLLSQSGPLSSGKT